MQSENYSLERQLFSYQRSLSIAQARNGIQPGGAEEDVVLPSGANGDYSSAGQGGSGGAGSSGAAHHHRDFFTRGRQESSDTEYA